MLTASHTKPRMKKKASLSAFLKSSLRGHRVVGFAILVVGGVPLDQHPGNVVTIVPTDVGPALPRSLDQERKRLRRALQSKLLGRQAKHLFALHELPDAIRGDNGIPLVGRLHQELVILGLPQDAVASGVAECPRHGEPWKVRAREVDAVVAGVDLADFTASSLQASLLFGEVGLVVLGAEDQP